MLKNFWQKLIFISLLAFISSCSLQNLSDLDHNACGGIDSIPLRYQALVGNWKCGKQTILLINGGGACWKVYENGKLDSSSGFILKLDSQIIELGCKLKGESKKFVIDEFPTSRDTSYRVSPSRLRDSTMKVYSYDKAWKMKLNGEEYYQEIN
jgi:hypothetical protein